MTSRTLRRWSWVHKWSSLLSSVVLLMLCVTGLPLIFHDEIDDLFGEHPAAAQAGAEAAVAPLTDILAAGEARRKGEFVQFVVWQRDKPEVVLLSMAASRTAMPDKNVVVEVDARTGQVLEGNSWAGAFMDVMLKAHTEMFAGITGKLLLGVVAIAFVASLVSGAVLYVPFMHKLAFGTVRRDKSVRTRWLDLHNLLGVAALSWLLVVGATGILNSWAHLLVQVWQQDQLASMLGPHRDRPLPDQMAPLDQVTATAKAAVPGKTPFFVAMPGSMLTSQSHFAVFMRGNTPLTSRLLQPVLIDASSGAFVSTRTLSWYMTVLLLSQPLHFGDYGGLWLKIVWALLDIVAILVIGSGIYLWVRPHARAPRPTEVLP